MIRRTAKSRIARAGGFTLIELLTVMVIVIVLMAVAIPTVIKVTSSSSVEAGSRMVGAQLRLARQEAITQRKHVAVLLPTVNTTNTPPDATAYTGFRPCIVTTTGGSVFTFSEWVPNTPWTYVPVGAVIREADNDGPNGTPPQPDLLEGAPNGTTVVVAGVPVFAADVRAVVFKPSGRLGGNGVDWGNVTLVEGAVPPGSAPVVKNTKNWVNIEINPYTGRPKYELPGQP